MKKSLNYNKLKEVIEVTEKALQDNKNDKSFKNKLKRKK